MLSHDRSPVSKFGSLMTPEEVKRIEELDPVAKDPEIETLMTEARRLGLEEPKLTKLRKNLEYLYEFPSWFVRYPNLDRDLA